MEAKIQSITTTYVDLRINVTELRVLMHRLAADGTYTKHRAEQLLPEHHEMIASELTEILRLAHDRSGLKTDD